MSNTQLGMKVGEEGVVVEQKEWGEAEEEEVNVEP